MPYCVKCRWDIHEKVEATHACRPAADLADIYDVSFLCPACASRHATTCHLILRGDAVLESLDEEHAKGARPKAGREEAEEPGVREPLAGDPGVEPPSPLPEAPEE